VVTGVVADVVGAITLVCVVLTPSPDEQEERRAAKASTMTALITVFLTARLAWEGSGHAAVDEPSFTAQLLWWGSSSG